MNIEISGHQIDTGDALKEHVVDHLQDAFDKFAERPTRAVVTFRKDGFEFVCECSVHLSTGMTTQSTGKGGNVYAAFDQAGERLTKQLRRYKRKLKNHHNMRSTPVSMTAVPSFVIEATSEAEPADTSAEETLQPVIIAETKTEIPTLSVGEAVLQMELGEEPLLLFRDEKSSSLAVVYRRSDGNIGWIDPDPAALAS